MIQFRVLGSIELQGPDGSEVGSILPRSKLTALLAYLAVATPRGFHRRDKIVGLFWPESDHDRARASLRRSVYNLRQGLGDEMVLSRGDDEVSLDWEGVWCDAYAFDQALLDGDTEAALDLYRGDLLDGFFLSESPEFDRWLGNERERMREAAAQAAWTLAHQRLADGRLTEGERLGQKAMDLVLTDENEVRRFIGALAASGDRAAAIRFFEKFSRLLAEELELDPDYETRELAQRIRSSDEARVRAEGRVSIPEKPQGKKGEGSTVRRIPWVIALPILTLAILLVALQSLDDPGHFDGVNTLIAVLPTSDFTKDPTLDGLAFAVASSVSEALDLAELGRVLLIESQGSGSDTSLGRLAAHQALRANWPDRTGADLAILSEIHRYGDTIHFSARMVDSENILVARMGPVTTHRSRPLESISEVQLSVISAVAEILAAEDFQRQWETPGERPGNLDVYTALREAVQVYGTEGAGPAIPLFNRASRVDPNYPVPVRWLVGLYWETGQFEKGDSLCQILDSEKDRFPRRARLVTEMNCGALRGDHGAALDKARLLLDFFNIYNVRVGFHALDLNRPVEAKEAFQRYEPTASPFATQFADSNARWLAQAHHWLGEHEEEIRVVQEARGVFPEYRFLVRAEIKALAALGRETEALITLDEGVRSLRGGEDPRFFLDDAAKEFNEHGNPSRARDLWQRLVAWYDDHPEKVGDPPIFRRRRAETLLHLGETKLALATLADLAEENPMTCGDQGRLAVALARLGNEEEAKQLSKELDSWEDPYIYGENRYWQAAIATALQEGDRAVAFLNLAMDEGIGFRRLAPHFNPYLSNLRGNPRFHDFLRPIG